MTRASDVVEARLPGRDRELDRVEQVVRTIESHAPFVVIRGEAGIGKTALWRAGLKAHRAAGHRVLSSRPTEEELQGPMVALVDLFEDAAPVPGTLEPDVDPLDRGRAVLRTLRQLADEQPVVIALDDLQWCDPISGRALRYALRRLDDEPVAMLATELVGSEADKTGEVVPPDRFEDLLLGPLPLDAIRHAVTAVVGPIPRPALERIYELSGGNPLYAVELARTADPHGSRLGASAPRTLRDVLSKRLAGVAPDVLKLLRTAAALGPCSVTTLSQLCAISPEVISTTVDDGLLMAGDDLLLRFSHPLFASVVLAEMNPLERQAIHARLAHVVSDPDDRARHLALSATEPDPIVAAELEQAATRAARRGAPAMGADLAAHSVRVTPSGDEASARRALRGISYRVAAGETSRALSLTDDLIKQLGPGPARVQAITQRVLLDFEHSEAFLDRAMADAGDDTNLRGRVIELRGWLLGLYRGQLEAGMELSAEALRLAKVDDDPVLELLAAGTLATTSLLAGHPRPELMQHALELADACGLPKRGRWPQTFRARQCIWGGRLPEARQHLEALAAEFARSGVEFQRPYRLSDLARLEVASGNLQEAIELARDGTEAAMDAGNMYAAAWMSYPVGLAHAHLGNPAAARDAATTLRSWGEDNDNPPRLLTAAHVLGVLALAEGDGETATAELLPAVALATGAGYRHPGFVPVLPDAVEATARAGDADTCSALSAELNDQAAALGEPWVDAAALRGRGLAALAAGDDAATDILGEAAAAFGSLGYRIDAARTMLLHGRALRRAGQRRSSAEVLTEARDSFSAIGAMPWVAQAVKELDRVAPSRGTGELTPTEVKIADLVAAGRRNREIAGELFVSVATVEAHLTRIYRKLGMRSRTELSRYMHQDTDS